MLVIVKCQYLCFALEYSLLGIEGLVFVYLSFDKLEVESNLNLPLFPDTVRDFEGAAVRYLLLFFAYTAALELSIQIPESH